MHREEGSREKEKGHCAWEAGTEARVPGGRSGLRAVQGLQGSSLSPGNQGAAAAKAVSEPEGAHTPEWSTGQRSTGKGMEGSQETKKKGRRCIINRLFSCIISLLSDHLCSMPFFYPQHCQQEFGSCYIPSYLSLSKKCSPVAGMEWRNHSPPSRAILNPSDKAREQENKENSFTVQ